MLWVYGGCLIVLLLLVGGIYAAHIARKKKLYNNSKEETEMLKESLLGWGGSHEGTHKYELDHEYALLQGATVQARYPNNYPYYEVSTPKHLYAWTNSNDNTCYTTTDQPKIGDVVYSAASSAYAPANTYTYGGPIVVAVNASTAPAQTYYAWTASYFERNPAGNPGTVYTTTENPQVGDKIYASDLSFDYTISAVTQNYYQYIGIMEPEDTTLTRDSTKDILPTSVYYAWEDTKKGGTYYSTTDPLSEGDTMYILSNSNFLAYAVVSANDLSTNRYDRDATNDKVITSSITTATTYTRDASKDTTGRTGVWASYKKLYPVPLDGGITDKMFKIWTNESFYAGGGLYSCYSKYWFDQQTHELIVATYAFQASGAYENSIQGAFAAYHPVTGEMLDRHPFVIFSDEYGHSLGDATGGCYVYYGNGVGPGDVNNFAPATFHLYFPKYHKYEVVEIDSTDIDLSHNNWDTHLVSLSRCTCDENTYAAYVTLYSEESSTWTRRIIQIKLSPSCPNGKYEVVYTETLPASSDMWHLWHTLAYNSYSKSDMNYNTVQGGGLFSHISDNRINVGFSDGPATPITKTNLYNSYYMVSNGTRTGVISSFNKRAAGGIYTPVYDPSTQRPLGGLVYYYNISKSLPTFNAHSIIFDSTYTSAANRFAPYVYGPMYQNYTSNNREQEYETVIATTQDNSSSPTKFEAYLLGFSPRDDEATNRVKQAYYKLALADKYTGNPYVINAGCVVITNRKSALTLSNYGTYDQGQSTTEPRYLSYFKISDWIPDPEYNDVIGPNDASTQTAGFFQYTLDTYTANLKFAAEHPTSYNLALIMEDDEPVHTMRTVKIIPTSPTASVRLSCGGLISTTGVMVVPEDSTVIMTVSEQGFETLTEAIEVEDQDVTLTPTLDPLQVTLTVNPSPVGATATISAPGYQTVSNVGPAQLTVDWGTQVTYSVSKPDFPTQTSTITLTSDQFLNVSLSITTTELYSSSTPGLYSFEIGSQYNYVTVEIAGATGQYPYYNSNGTLVNYTDAAPGRGAKLLFTVPLTNHTITGVIGATPADYTSSAFGYEYGGLGASSTSVINGKTYTQQSGGGGGSTSIVIDGVTTVVGGGSGARIGNCASGAGGGPNGGPASLPDRMPTLIKAPTRYPGNDATTPNATGFNANGNGYVTISAGYDPSYA